MKKIIALAVAGAFAMPAVADISLSGEVEYFYKSVENGEASLNDSESNVFISGSSELNNGFSIAAKINMRSDDADNTAEGGSSITIGMNEYGALAIGDVAGPADSFDDIADQSAQGGASGGFQDAGIVYTLPALVEGLTIKYGVTPDSTAIGTKTDAVKSDFQGLAAQYNFSNYSIYYGTDEYTTSQVDYEENGYGVKATFGGIMVAAEVASLTDSNAATTAHRDYDTYAVTYDAGNGITLAVTNHEETDAAGAPQNDTTSYTAFYDAGPGVTMYAEQAEDKQTADSSAMYLGVEYKF